MPVLRNASPCGDLDVPLLGQIVEAGAEVEVTVDQAQRLLPQEIWEAVDDHAIAMRVELDKPPELDDDEFGDVPGEDESA